MVDALLSYLDGVKVNPTYIIQGWDKCMEYIVSSMIAMP